MKPELAPFALVRFNEARAWWPVDEMPKSMREILAIDDWRAAHGDEVRAWLYEQVPALRHSDDRVVAITFQRDVHNGRVADSETCVDRRRLFGDHSLVERWIDTDEVLRRLEEEWPERHAEQLARERQRLTRGSGA